MSGFTPLTRLALLTMLAAFPLAVPRDGAAQSGEHTTVTAAGERYRAGPFHRWILGRHYRDVWTQPVEVEYLELNNLAGGLRPTRTGGSQQTKSLRFMGADGREYTFRSVDKDPSPVLDSLLHGTVVDDLVQDGISAAHPYGALVAAPLLEAAGVLHVDPKLAVMPDDPALGEFRSQFAGVLGLIEERPDENGGERAAFANTVRVIASETLVEHVGYGPEDLVDAEAFLTARLVDLFLGDWDRHRGQWRWAIYSEETPRRWLPIPRDRDQAFAKFDGVATRIVGAYMPQFVRFDEEYPGMVGLNWNARELDRWILAGLDRAAWDSIGAQLVERLTDDAIDAATRSLPPEIYALGGAELARTLAVRRDHLPEAWSDFYELLADQVTIYGTRSDEVVTIDRSEPGSVTVEMSAPAVAPGNYFERRYLTSETRELRIYLGRGDDRVVVQGEAETGITIRLIGDRGDDSFEIAAPGKGVRLYDARGDNVVSGGGAQSIDATRYEEWEWSEEDRAQPRDWGRRRLPLFWSGYSSALGPVIGGGVRWDTFAFRKQPYSSSVSLRLGFAPVLAKGQAEVDGRFNFENSSMFWSFGGRLSRLEVTHYYGLGNATTTGGGDFHEVDQTALKGWIGIGASADERVTLSGDLFLERVSTQENVGRFFETLGPVYGAGAFVQLGATAALILDPYVNATAGGTRLRLTLEGSLFPTAFDVESTTGNTSAEASLLLATSPSPRVALALKAGGERVWGRFPWHHAAFLGGLSTLRGWDEQRFAGDAAAFGSAELRLRAWQPRIIVPSALGVFAFAEAGRVSVDGISTGGWHGSSGGGLWLQPALQPFVFRAGVGATEESTQLFVTLGLPY